MIYKHTPGPWVVTKSPSHNGYWVHSADRDSGPDISVFAPYGAREKERQAQAFADATLVASAPNLAHMVASLLSDARRRQEIEPNAGTAARIAEAVELLERVRGE